MITEKEAIEYLEAAEWWALVPKRFRAKVTAYYIDQLGKDGYGRGMARQAAFHYCKGLLA